MRQAAITIYKFNELPEKIREKILRDWSANSYEDYSEEFDSIKAFCDYFNVKLINYEIGAYYPLEYRTDATMDNFRNRKLKEFQRDYMPTGYWLDCSLWNTFYDHFKSTGDAKESFDAGLRQGFLNLVKEMEYRLSDEFIIECINDNDYEFYDDGTMA